MGKGDRRTRRGKIWRGTYGNTRPKNKKKKSSKGARSYKSSWFGRFFLLGAGHDLALRTVR